MTQSLFVSPEQALGYRSSGFYDPWNDKKIVISDDHIIYEYRDDGAELDLSAMFNQRVIPGNAFNISFNITGCSVLADDNITFSLKSQLAEIGINHDIIIKDGQCSEIRDLYGISSDCSKGITPIITKQSNITSFIVDVEGDEKYTFVQSNFEVKVSECPIGFGYDDDAILLDCSECPINSFKITSGNEPCFACNEQNGYSCEGSFDITINYNKWFIGYDEEFILPFHVSSNDKLFAIQCPVKLHLYSFISYIL